MQTKCVFSGTWPVLSMREFGLENFTSWELSHMNTRQGNLIIEYVSPHILCPFTLIYSFWWYFYLFHSMHQTVDKWLALILHFDFMFPLICWHTSSLLQKYKIHMNGNEIFINRSNLLLPVSCYNDDLHILLSKWIKRSRRYKNFIVCFS